MSARRLRLAPLLYGAGSGRNEQYLRQLLLYKPIQLFNKFENRC